MKRRVELQELNDKVMSGVVSLGYSQKDAQIISDVLLYAQMRGNNQGVVKIATGGIPKATELEPFSEVSSSKCGALLSGGHSMVTIAKATDKAVSLAKSHGVGVVGVNHTKTSSGAIGYFSRRIAKAGYIAIVCVGNGGFAFVAPTGSTEAKLGTNPLSYAFPYIGGEVVFDTTTAAMAYFGIVEAKIKGVPIPKGVGFDKNGNPSTNASDVLSGSVSAFSGHKGFGFSLLVQLLGGPFTGSGIPGYNEENGAGAFVLAIDPGLLISKEEFMKRSTELATSIKEAKPSEGQAVYLPGERGDSLAKEVQDSGWIDIDEAIWDELLTFTKM